ncbi:MAG TPA: alpha/beta fold hydrolase [Ramlibacter sp.]|nr:alpha/beta fold hydrolase [Ramlibacter sp.]
MSGPQRWVLLRGLARESAHWGDFPSLLAARLGAGHEVITLDLPGNGRWHAQRSPTSVAAMTLACRQQFAALCAPAAPGALRLVAMSLGAMVALEWARTAPQEVAACALVNTSLRAFSPFWRRLQPGNYPSLLCLLAPGMSADRREALVLRMTSAQPGRHVQAARAWTQLARARPVSAANGLRQLIAAASYAGPSRPPDAELLLLCSAGDRLVSPACSRAIAQAWDRPLAEHPWAGHDLPLDDPAWLVERLALWGA